MRLAKSFNQSAAAVDAAQETTTEGSLEPAQESVHMHSCETAQYFFVQEVLSRWEDFISKMAQTVPAGCSTSTDSVPILNVAYDPQTIRTHFPFMEFFTGHKSPPTEIVEQLFPVGFVQISFIFSVYPKYATYCILLFIKTERVRGNLISIHH